ncbi:MAG TPA: hypothetical protein VGP94_06835 [Tepidisphaeraceae bacterium]|jgi:hypothetical protein|nr:hypothetical protein [Tepidisphaeraceae bacterium]
MTNAARFRLNLWSCAILGLVFLCRLATAGQTNAPGRVDVILWFDTEDYLLPADDDASKRLAEMLTSKGVRATFKVVGEKARVLEKRGRTDVIEALKKHDIGYHANYHSVHPTPSEYLADCGLLDGMEEFIRREGGGAADVRRIFGVDTLACYGQPGSSWGSQTIAALGQIGVAPNGIPTYVDEGNHIGLKGRPFWYCNALVVYDMPPNRTRFELHIPQALEPGKKAVSEIAARLKNEGGGLISIFYHPCEWVHKQFWDGVNFSRGANPPRSQWKAPPQRTAEETEAAFDRFGQYIDHIKSLGVRFVTASELSTIYVDKVRSQGASEEEVGEIATRLAKDDSKGIDFVVINGKSFSPADQMEILLWADEKTPQGLLGPDGAGPAVGEGSPQKVDWPAFETALRDVKDFIKREKRVPARVFIGADAVRPEDFLVGLARAYVEKKRSGSWPSEVVLGKNVELLTAQHVAKDSPGIFGGWVIHKEGFRAPKILEVARWQAWTLKPALR